VTLQTVSPPIIWPLVRSVTGEAAPQFDSAAASLLDAVGEKIAFVFQAPKSGTISKLHLRTATVTTGDDVDVRLETVGADGFPSGTLATANSNASQTIQDTDDNTWFACTLTAAHTSTVGDWLAVVIEAPTGYTGNLFLAVARRYEKTDYVGGLFFGSCDYHSSAWAKYLSPMAVRVEYSDGSFPFIPHASGPTTLSEYTFNSGSTPDEIGLYFTLPFRASCCGALVAVEADADFDVKLYGPSTLTRSIDKDYSYYSGSVHDHVVVLFTSTVILEADTAYRLTVLPGASNVSLAYAGFAAVAHREQMGFADLYKTSRTDAGSWTEDNTEAPWLALLVDQLDDGAGGAMGARAMLLSGYARA
jgi:hypothetical protein